MNAACGLLLVLAGAWGQATPAPTDEQIDRWVKDLGADDFAARQTATDALWQAGPAAIVALTEAARSNDPEIRFRAKAVLDKVRSGIRPDTPPELAALIDQFRFGAEAAQRQALGELRAKGQWSIVLALLRAEKNADRRRVLALAVAPDAGKLVRPLIEKGELDDAQTILELTAVQQSGLVQLTTFLLLTDRLNDATAEVQRRLTSDPQPEDWLRLAWFSRAKGDLPAAIAAAEKTADKYLALNLVSESRDWKRAATLMTDLAATNPAATDHAAFLATFQRLAGNDAAYAAAIKTFGQPPAAVAPKPADPFAPMPRGDDPFGVPVASATKTWALAETLLINEQPTEAIVALLDFSPERAATLLRQRQQVERLLELAKVKDDTTFDAVWLASLPASPGDAKLQARARFAVAGQAALVLRDLGRKPAVEQILKTLEAVAVNDADDGRRWAAVAKLLWQLGRYDDALKAAALAAGFLPPSQVFGEFIKPQAQLAAFWFGSAKDIDPLVDREKACAEAVWMAVPRPPPGKAIADWQKRVAAAATHVRKLEPTVRAAYLSLIAETCLIRGDRKLGRQFYGEAAEISPAAAVKAGDLAAGDDDWAAAEKWYRQATDVADARAAAPPAADPFAAPVAVPAQAEADPLALFLHGRALLKLDRQAEGEQRQKLAALVPLTPEARWPLATGLQERGLSAEALAQFEIIRRTAPPDSALVVNAGQQVGNLLSGKEPLRAAECWQQLQLHVLNSNSNFIEVEGYLTLPHVMHKVRAKGFLEQGKTAEALLELAICQRLMPGDVRLIEELIPRLDKAGLTADADKLFMVAYDVHAELAKAHPTAAAFLNNTAWLSARARRKLDEALPLAQKAIELAPTEAAYLDTLAEVQFQRGDRPAAIAAAKKAIELSPGNQFYEKRLAHFEKDEPGLDTDPGTPAP